jgi:tetratricopeptide (TPR) repeat protein
VDPDLPVAHNLYAQLEVELGRPVDAAARLLARLTLRSEDAELYAGLVHACRYCGLLDASIAAHERARELDAYVQTSATNTYFAAADYTRAESTFSTADTEYLRCLTLTMLGREEEALRIAEQACPTPAEELRRPFLVSLRYLLRGDRARSVEWFRRAARGVLQDAEVLFYMGRQLAYLEERTDALDALRGAVTRGYFAAEAFERDPWLASLRSTPEFGALCDRARREQRGARDALASAGLYSTLGSKNTR